MQITISTDRNDHTTDFLIKEKIECQDNIILYRIEKNALRIVKATKTNKFVGGANYDNKAK